MTRTTRTSSGRADRRARGSFGQWTTGDRTGAVQEHRGWDAARLAVVDGGGCLLGLAATDPKADGEDVAQTTTRRPGRRTTRTSRKGGRR